MAFDFNQYSQSGRPLTAPEWSAAQYGHLTEDPYGHPNGPYAPHRQFAQQGQSSTIPGQNVFPTEPATPAPTSGTAPPTSTPAPTVTPNPGDDWRNQVLNQIGQQGSQNFDWNNINTALLGMGGQTAGAAKYNADNLDGEGGFVAKAETVNRDAYQKPIRDTQEKATQLANQQQQQAQAQQAATQRANQQAQQNAQAQQNSQKLQAQQANQQWMDMLRQQQEQAANANLENHNRSQADPYGLAYAAAQQRNQGMQFGNQGGANPVMQPLQTQQFQGQQFNPQAQVGSVNQAQLPQQAQVPQQAPVQQQMPVQPPVQAPLPAPTYPVKHSEPPVMRPIPVPGDTNPGNYNGNQGPVMTPGGGGTGAPLQGGVPGSLNLGNVMNNIQSHYPGIQNNPQAMARIQQLMQRLQAARAYRGTNGGNQ